MSLDFTFQDLTPTLWRDSIIQLMRSSDIKDTTLGWSLINLEEYLPRQIPDGEIFVDRISIRGWDAIAYQHLILKVKPKNKKCIIDVLKPDVEVALINLVLFYISNCSNHEMIHLAGEYHDEPLVYHLTTELMSAAEGGFCDIPVIELEYNEDE